MYKYSNKKVSLTSLGFNKISNQQVGYRGALPQKPLGNPSGLSDVNINSLGNRANTAMSVARNSGIGMHQQKPVI